MQRRRPRGRGAARIDHDQRAAALPLRLEVPHASAASSRPGCRRRAGWRRRPGCPRAGRAGRGRGRRRGCRPRPPRTCRSGRCSRCCGCRGATRANLPSSVGLLVGQRAAAEDADRIGPARSCAARMPGANRSSASSQLAGRSGASRLRAAAASVGRSGASSRLGGRPALAAEPARLVGKSRGATSSLPSCSTSVHRALHGAIGAMRAAAGVQHLHQIRPTPAMAPQVVRQRRLDAVRPISASSASAAKIRSPAW